MSLPTLKTVCSKMPHVPAPLVRAAFAYDKFSGIYRTSATYLELVQLGAKLETVEV